MVNVFSSFFVITSLCFANGVEGNTTNLEDGYSFAEHELAHFNMFKTIGIWIIRVMSDSLFMGTHLSMAMSDNKIIFELYNGDKEVAVAVLSHIPGSKAVDVNGNAQGIELSNKAVFLHLDDDICVCVWILPKGMKNFITIAVRHDSHIDNERIRKLIFDKLMANPNTRRLIADMIPTLKWVNKNPVKIIPGTENVPIHYDDLIDADITGAVGNWSIKASTFKDQVFRDIEHFEITLEENKEIVTLFQGEKIIGMGQLGYIKGTKLWLLDLYLTYTRKYFPIQFMLVYVDQNINISVQKLKGIELHLTVLARNGVPFPKEYVKRLISDYVLFNPDIKRAVKDTLPDLTFF